MDTLLRIVVIAQQGLKEAWYSRFYSLLCLVIVLCAGLGLFAGELVLSGADGTRLSVYNFILRLALVGVFAIHVIQSLLRDRIDKQTEVMLSLDMPREIYVLGRLLGFLAVSLIAVLVAILYPLWFSSPLTVAGWGLSLYTELAMIICLAGFVTISLNNAAACFSLVAGLYFLARNMGNLLLLSQSPILEGRDSGLDWMTAVLQAINTVLPDLWRFAPSEWLINNTADLSAVGMNMLTAAIFCLLLFAATGFDLHRKNL
ncbi:ABC-type Na+ efflux pump permease subunit [Methylohalomonas lacus]|uniref:ABC-type Na+ efflux pump permease subunit n=1 Tax=Methylohalomonas lacus TaxID=398773 RepID=A0AAE3HNB5_9GAMM|nr:hypothetical protein [Methylohalomonas lacus]MCS3904426.1 ABC-type Na+ efflux pump permease subunit [Methylohalomonas lacus]